MSQLPPVSRGGIVRKASLAIGSVASTAPCALGGRTAPPRRNKSSSRAANWASSAREGATPITPINGLPGMRTSGRSGDTANPPSMVHLIRNGVGKKSRRKPNPGTTVVKPKG
jgi:hypothetical protein